MRAIVVVSLMCTLILLCTGLVVLFHPRDRSEEMNGTFPLSAEERSPVPPEDNETVYDGENEVTTATLDDALHSINSSLERLQAINDRIHEQNESLIRISHALSGYRDFKTETAQFRHFPSVRETPPAASSAAPAKTEPRAPIPFVSPAGPGQSLSLSEAEILAIHLNNIKLMRETTFFRNDGYSKSQP
ncbi:MAG: hypothetical protein LBU21_04780 [Treponema sp.]|nr:hypothetical protein [Treponema sp.]